MEEVEKRMVVRKILYGLCTALVLLLSLAIPSSAQSVSTQSGPLGVTYDAPDGWTVQDAATIETGNTLSITQSPVPLSEWNTKIDAPTQIFFLDHICGGCWDGKFGAYIVPLDKSLWMSAEEARRVYETDGLLIKAMGLFAQDGLRQQLLESGKFESVKFRSTEIAFFSRLSCMVFKHDLVFNNGVMVEQQSFSCPLGKHQIIFKLMSTPDRAESHLSVAKKVIESVRWVE